MPTKHGKRVKRIVLLTPEQDTRLQDMAKREMRSVSEMAAVIIDKATRDGAPLKQTS